MKGDVAGVKVNRQPNI